MSLGMVVRKPAGSFLPPPTLAARGQKRKKGAVEQGEKAKESEADLLFWQKERKCTGSAQASKRAKTG